MRPPRESTPDAATSRGARKIAKRGSADCAAPARNRLAVAAEASGLDTLPVSTCNRLPDFYALASFRRLSPNAQRALACLWCMPAGEMLGIVEGAAALVAHRLEMSRPRAASALGELGHAGFVVECATTGLVVLVGYLERRLGGEPMTNPTRWGVATARALGRLPAGELTATFRNRYGLPQKPPRDGRQNSRKRRVADRVSGRVGDTLHDSLHGTPSLSASLGCSAVGAVGTRGAAGAAPVLVRAARSDAPADAEVPHARR
jgi:hypothetical protein